MKSYLATLSLGILVMAAAMAQNPIANRVKAIVSTLPPHSTVVAKYTDTQRHCLYYVLGHRLYKYDVMTNGPEEIPFSNSSYTQILNTWLSPDGNFIFLSVDRGNLSPIYLESGQELWRYDSRTKRIYKVGEGYRISHRRQCIVIKRASRCINPSAPPSRQRWMGREHYFDLYGKVIWAKEEFEIAASTLHRVTSSR